LRKKERMSEITQTNIDEAIANWKESPETVYSSEEAVELFEKFTLDAEEWASIYDNSIWEWTEESPEAISDSISEDRLAELEEGAEPNQEEIELWHSTVSGDAIHSQNLKVYRLSNSSEESVWFSVTTDGMLEDSEIIDAGGPFFHVDSLLDHLLEKVQEWGQWEIMDAFGEGAQEAMAKLTEMS
jgi:hypothetical protein